MQDLFYQIVQMGDGGVSTCVQVPEVSRGGGRPSERAALAGGAKLSDVAAGN